MLARVPHMLQALYEADPQVLSEDAILMWADTTSAAAGKSKEREKLAKSIRDKALPFITWLK